MMIHAQMCTHKLWMRTLTIKRAHARLKLVHAHLCTNLHKILNLSSQDSIWPPHKISWRSELSLRRYLQNNTGVCLILNFQCILPIFTIWASKFLKHWKLFKSCFCFLMLISKWKIISKTFHIIELRYSWYGQMLRGQKLPCLSPDSWNLF